MITLKEIKDRWKFWKSSRRGETPFWYSVAKGTHYAVDSYNPFTDEVSYRYGQFGTCGFPPYPKMSRTNFLNLHTKGYQDDRLVP